MAHSSVKIIENGFVVTCDKQSRVGKYTVVVKDERIIEVNAHGEGARLHYPTAEVIDAHGKLILPGFIDPHYHGASFLLRRSFYPYTVEPSQQEEILRDGWLRFEKELTPDELHNAYLVAYFCALKSGISTVGEFSFGMMDLPLIPIVEAIKRSDMKCVIGLHNGDQIEKAKTVTSRTTRFALALPNEDDLTTYGLQTYLRLARDLKYPLLVHLGETDTGHATIKKNFGKSVVKVLDEFKFFSVPLILAQLSHIEKSDIGILAKAKIPVIVTPLSTKRKRYAHPPYEAMAKKQIPLALASDWGVADPIANMKAFIELALTGGFPLPSGPELVAMHTLNGAKALGIGDETGSLEVGKKADITMLNINDLQAQSLMDSGTPEREVFNLLMELSNRDVCDVIINGEYFVRQRVILTYAEEELIMLARRLTEKLVPPLQMKSHTEEYSTNLRTLESQEAREEWTAPIEEGFRVIRKTGTQSSVKEELNVPELNIEPRHHTVVASTPAKTTAPIKRVFGEDDL
jgi:5-methylthioadenosine/S-adenosylhomocysteine deaminase